MSTDFWKERRVFVTGATGFVGSHLCEKLVNEGAEVTILERDFIPKSYLYHSGVAKKVNIVSGNIEEELDKCPTMPRISGNIKDTMIEPDIFTGELDMAFIFNFQYIKSF